MKEELAVNSLRPVKEIFDEFGIQFVMSMGILLKLFGMGR